MTTRRLVIHHHTEYQFDRPVHYALQKLRLRPKSAHGQHVEDWHIELDGGTIEAEAEDHHLNHVALISIEPGRLHLSIHCRGSVEVEDQTGIVGKHRGFMPLWAFLKPTPMTQAGRGIRTLLGSFQFEPDDAIASLHALSGLILQAMPYEEGHTGSDTSAEQAVALGRGVCQDHSHVFLAAARHLGIPARYVSGYLLIDGVTDQSASHAWVEAHVDGLGWIGFDVSNGISPDNRYIRVATGFDYSDAAPITGLSYGARDESMVVSLRVEQ